MKKSHLVACAVCARHVRANEAACPFCRAALPRALREAAAPRPPAVRLGRAALLALGTGAATIAAACGGNVVESGGDHQGVSEPPYGAVPWDAGDDGGDGSVDGAVDTGSMGVALYGGISPEDASVGTHDASVADASQTPDSSSAPDTGVVPPYGQPPGPPPPPDEDAGD